MANATFGVNIIPKSNTVTLGNSDSPWNIVSPSLTGTPTAPTAAASTNNTQVATTAFVKNALPGTMGGATSSAAGTSGLVPAPSSGDNTKFLKGDGSWGDLTASRVWVVNLDTVTVSTAGSYTHTTTVQNMSGSMKPIVIECGNPEIFKAAVTVTTGTNSVTLTCSDVAVGSSTVTVSMLMQGTNDSPLASGEYAELSGRVGQLSSLNTSVKTSIVNALNSVAENSIVELMTPSEAFSIPASGNSVSYDMDGITANHELLKWNFSSSAENSPPCSLEWTTYDGYFTITNTAGTTSETMKPVFGVPAAKTITTHTF